MRWFFRASVSDCSNPRLCRLLLFIPPIPSRFLNPRHSHHTYSSSHLGVPCLRTRISNCHTSSSDPLVVACLRLSIPITHTYFLSLPVAFLLHAHISTAPLPPFRFTLVFQRSPEVVFPSPLGAATPSSSAPLLHTLSPLQVPLLSDEAPPTAPWLPAITLCKP